MTMDLKRVRVLALAVAACASGQARAQEPALVAAYTRQLAERCGPLPAGAAAPSLVDRLDLNGDGKDEWVVDAGRYPCPGRSALATAAGAQVTVFKGIDGGVAVPAFQTAAFGSRLQRTPEGTVVLVITVGARDCAAEDAQARCERRLLWRATEGRFELAPAAPVKTRATPTR
jgi:hypothetical protein